MAAVTTTVNDETKKKNTSSIPKDEILRMSAKMDAESISKLFDSIVETLEEYDDYRITMVIEKVNN